MLINDTKPGEDNSKISWYPEPHYRFVRICKESSKEMTGTFRSPECLRCADVGTFKNDMCSACEVCPIFYLSRNANYCEVKELVLMVRETTPQLETTSFHI